MNKKLFAAAFVLGALAVAWIGAGYVGTNLLALVMTVLIGAVYVMGALELRHFRQATASLSTALANIPDTLTHLGGWLDRLPPSLQNPVRLRIEGERSALPGLALTPYLVGLLVMLGMLGTFVGMVITLNGAVFALEGTADIEAMRAALAAPIKGLGHAFGTSVAGVAASAMLGLMSALSRRDRMQAVQFLDLNIATTLHGFSFAHQRQETFRALQAQAKVLPDVVDKLHALTAQMERGNQQLGEKLLASQAHFHDNAKTVYTALADSVGQSLKESLAESTRVAGESVKPLVASVMTGIAQEARTMHERMVETTQAQLDGFATRFDANAGKAAEAWNTALAQHASASDSMVGNVGRTLETFSETFQQRSSSLLAAVDAASAARLAEQASTDQQRLAAWTAALEKMAASLREAWQQAGAQSLAQQEQICATLEKTARDMTAQAETHANTTLAEITRLLRSADALVQSRADADATWLKQHEARMDQLASQWRSELDSFRAQEAQRGNAAVERMGELQTAMTSHLATLGSALEDPITRLIHTASEAPRAAADVIGQMREEMSNSMARDNQVLEERSRIMQTLNALLDAINHAAAEQRTAIDALVTTSAELLDRVGHQFAAKVDAESARMSEGAAHVTSSVVEISSLGESFGFAVQTFNASSEKLIANLQRIEAAMDKSMTRSDEQLAYYVAQAREIIDLSIMAQKGVVDDLRQLAAKPALHDGGAR